MVNGRSVVAIDIGPEVNRRDLVAASIRARDGSGRVVVERVQEMDGSEGIGGLGLSLGAPAAAPEWWFADGGAVAPEDETAEGEEPAPTTVAESETEGEIPVSDAPVDPTAGGDLRDPQPQRARCGDPGRRSGGRGRTLRANGPRRLRHRRRNDGVQSCAVGSPLWRRGDLRQRRPHRGGARSGTTPTAPRWRSPKDAAGWPPRWSAGPRRSPTSSPAAVALHNPSSESLVEVTVATADGEVVEREIDPNVWELFDVPVGLVQVTSSLPIVGELEVRGEGVGHRLDAGPRRRG